MKYALDNNFVITEVPDTSEDGMTKKELCGAMRIMVMNRQVEIKDKEAEIDKINNDITDINKEIKKLNTLMNSVWDR